MLLSDYNALSAPRLTGPKYTIKKTLSSLQCPPTKTTIPNKIIKKDPNSDKRGNRIEHAKMYSFD